MPKDYMTSLKLPKAAMPKSATDSTKIPDLDTLQSQLSILQVDNKVDNINTKLDILLARFSDINQKINKMDLELRSIVESRKSNFSFEETKISDRIEEVKNVDEEKEIDIPDYTEEPRYGDEVTPIEKIKWSEYSDSWNFWEDKNVCSFVDAFKEISLEDSICIFNKSILEKSCNNNLDIYEKILFLNQKIFQDWREKIDFTSQDKVQEISIFYNDTIHNIVDSIWLNSLETIMPVIGYIGTYLLSIALVFEIAIIMQQCSAHKGYFIPISIVRNVIQERLRILYRRKLEENRLYRYTSQVQDLLAANANIEKLSILHILKRGSFIFIRYSVVSLVSMSLTWFYLNKGNNLSRSNKLLSKAQGKMFKALIELWMKYYKKW